MTLRHACATIALLVFATPALADSQSSNSSSNCSNGRCTNVETYSEQSGRHRWGYTRVERWRESPSGRHYRRDDDDD